MPIIGTTRTPEDETATTWGSSTTATATDETSQTPWYQSTIITTRVGPQPPDNIPDLTTIYTPPESCLSRWMLPIANTGAATATSQTQTTVFSTQPRPAQDGADSSYLPCQRFSTLTYSPGICPDGQTIVQITEVHELRSAGEGEGGTATFWQASCCRSGMTFGPEYSIGCISRFSTPLTAYQADYITTVGEVLSIVGTSIRTLVLAPTATSAGETSVLIPLVPTTQSTLDSIPTTTSALAPRAILDPSSAAAQSGTNDYLNTTSVVIESGIAIADPIVIGWESTHLSTFPPSYASSLAKRIGVSFTATASPAPSPSPQPTNSTSSSSSSSKSQTLSSGQIAGISIGVISGVALLGLCILGILYVKKKRWRQKVGNSNVGEGLPHLPEMEDQTGWIHVGKKWLLGGRWRWEADSKTGVQELDAEGRTHELDGDNGLHQELDSRGVNVVVVPGEPVELDAAEGGKEEGPESEE